MIKVLVADNNYLSRQGLVYLLSEIKSVKSLPSVDNGKDLEIACAYHRPDVLVIDYSSPSFSIQSVISVKTKFNNINVMAIASGQTRQMIMKALDSGVISYLLKDCDKEEIIEAITKTSLGEKYLCNKVLDAILNKSDVFEDAIDTQVVSCKGVGISDREMEIVKLIAEGHSNKQIADMLFLSLHTVTTHRKNIMAKLKINNTAGIVLYAVRENIVSPNHFLFSQVN